MGQANNGIGKIELGAIGALGVMGTALSSLGFTEEDSAKINFEEPQKTEFMVEEVDTAFFTAMKAGKKSFVFTVANPDVDTLVKVFGGSKTGVDALAIYKAPAITPVIEQSLKITPKVGLGFNFPRVLVSAVFTDSIGRNSLLGVTVTCDVLQPTAPAEPVYSTFNVASV